MKLKVLPIDRAARELSKTPLIAFISRLEGKIRQITYLVHSSIVWVFDLDAMLDAKSKKTAGPKREEGSPVKP